MFELQFLVMVDTEMSLDRLVEEIRANLPGARSVRPRSFDWQHNWIQIWENDDYEPPSTRPEADPFLYFRYRMEVSPTPEDVQLQQQLDVARELKRAVESIGALAVVCADFEELLNRGRG